MTFRNLLWTEEHFLKFIHGQKAFERIPMNRKNIKNLQLIENLLKDSSLLRIPFKRIQWTEDFVRSLFKVLPWTKDLLITSIDRRTFKDLLWTEDLLKDFYFIQKCNKRKILT